MISRSQGEETTLTKDSVLNIQNVDTGLFLCTRKMYVLGEEDSDEDDSEEQNIVEEDVNNMIAAPI